MLLLLFYIALLVVRCSNANLIQDDLSDYTHKILECIRIGFSNALLDYNTPNHNSLKNGNFKIDFDKMGVLEVSGTLKVTDLKLTGITDWQKPNVRERILPLGKIPKFEINYQKVYSRLCLSSRYELDMRYGGFDFWGNGSIQLVAVNLTEDISLRLTRSGGPILEYFKFMIDLERFDKFVITGVRNDEAHSSLLSSMFLAHGGQIISDFAEDIDRIIGKIVFTNLFFGGEDGKHFVDTDLTKCYNELINI